MTKMITNITKERFYEDEEFKPEIRCLVSDDKLELIELLTDKLKTMERGESVIVNFVNEKDEEDEIRLKGNEVEEVHTHYDIGLTN